MTRVCHTSTPFRHATLVVCATLGGALGASLAAAARPVLAQGFDVPKSQDPGQLPGRSRGTARPLHPPLFAEAAASVAWDRYALITQCVSATGRVQQAESENAIRRRGGEPPPEDSTVLAMLDHQFPPPPAAVVAVAKRCRAAFSAATVPSRQLPELLELAKAAHDLPLADSIITRQLAEAPATSDRAHAAVIVSAGIAMVAADMVPAADSVAWAAYADRLERMVATRWPGAVMPRVGLAVNRLLGLAIRGLQLETDTASTPVHVADLEPGYRELVTLASLTPSEPLSQDEQHGLDMLKRGIAALPFGMQVRVIEEAPQASADGLRRMLLQLDSVVTGGHPNTVGLGAPPPALTGEYWFRSGSRELRTGQPPLPAGHPTFVYLSDGADENFYMLLRLKRLLDAVPELELVIVSPSYGVAHRSLRGPGNNRVRGMWGLVRDTASLAAEAESVRRFFFDELGLRGTLMIDTVPAWQVPAPDSRISGDPWPTRARYMEAGWIDPTQPAAIWFLLDGQGRTVLHDNLAIVPRGLAAVVRRLAVLATVPGH